MAAGQPGSHEKDRQIVKLAGEQSIAVPRQQVWEGLNDPEVLQQCIPGCQSLEKESDERLKAIVQIKVGPIGAKFAGAVTLSDLDPPNAYTITGEGAGGAAGFAKGSAKVRLADDNGGTLLSYDVDAQVGGRIAQLGGAIIDATAKQLAGTFFRRFGEIMAERGVPAAAESAPAEGLPSAETALPEPSARIASPAVAPRRRTLPWIWIIAVAAAALAGLVVGRRSDSISVREGFSVLLLVAIVAIAGFVIGRLSAGPRVREEEE
jgi:carbon monoxide dehydrogenase subunit G